MECFEIRYSLSPPGGRRSRFGIMRLRITLMSGEHDGGWFGVALNRPERFREEREDYTFGGGVVKAVVGEQAVHRLVRYPVWPN